MDRNAKCIVREVRGEDGRGVADYGPRPMGYLEENVWVGNGERNMWIDAFASEGRVYNQRAKTGARKRKK